MPTLPTGVVTFLFTDIEASTRKVAESGGKVLMHPMAVDTVGRFSVVKDPQGATFALIEFSRPMS